MRYKYEGMYSSNNDYYPLGGLACDNGNKGNNDNNSNNQDDDKSKDNDDNNDGNDNNGGKNNQNNGKGNNQNQGGGKGKKGNNKNNEPKKVPPKNMAITFLEFRSRYHSYHINFYLLETFNIFTLLASIQVNETVTLYLIFNYFQR